jgi:pimeloyl-ACP methyl ester carboxylesterase
MARRMQNPVIAIPGITATGLRDEYPIDSERVWTMLRKNYQRIAMHPNDLRYELLEPARVVPNEVWSLPYSELIAELSYELSSGPEELTPVYPFPYDWRQPIENTREQLASFIDEVIGRTKLLKHAHKGNPSWADDPKVDLVGHSMGGMLIASYIAKYKTECAVGKVATLGTPFQGSLEAVLKLATGEGAPGAERTSQRDRESARLTPAVYHLLPSFKGAIQSADGLPSTIFDIRCMQDSTWKSIASAIKLYGPDPSDKNSQAQEILKNILKQAKSCVNTINHPDLLANADMDPSRWLCVIGVGEMTRTHAVINTKNGKARYDLDSLDRENFWGDVDPRLRVQTGDGTVPYLGAKPKFLPTESLVLVQDSDFDWFGEFGDRVLAGQAGFHGMLCKLNLVQRLVISHFKGKKHGRVWGRSAPEISSEDWNPPIVNLELK